MLIITVSSNNGQVAAPVRAWRLPISEKPEGQLCAERASLRRHILIDHSVDTDMSMVLS